MCCIPISLDFCLKNSLSGFSGWASLFFVILVVAFGCSDFL